MMSPYVIWYLLISIAYDTMGVTREQFLKVLSLPDDRSEVVHEHKKQRRLLQISDLVFFVNYLLYDKQLNVYSESVKRLQDDFTFLSYRPRDPKEAKLLGNSTMILRNNFRFKAEWSNPFNISAKVKGYSGDGSAETELDVMYLKARLRSSDIQSLHASVIELPYRGDRYCMLLLRPHRGYDVRQVLGNLREMSLKDIFAKLQSDVDEFGLQEVEVKLPCTPRVSSIFLESYVNLNKPPLKMGLSDMFEKDSANFDSFAKDNMYIGEISQRLYLFMTENETSVESSTPGFKFEKIPAEVAVKDPLIFFIMEKSSVTMLLGGFYSKIPLE